MTAKIKCQIAGEFDPEHKAVVLEKGQIEPELASGQSLGR